MKKKNSTTRRCALFSLRESVRAYIFLNHVVYFDQIMHHSVLLSNLRSPFSCTLRSVDFELFSLRDEASAAVHVHLSL